MPEPILLAWSGGKDSTLALAALRSDPAFRVLGLLTSVSSAHDRISIHGVRRTILQAQSQALGLPVFEASLEPDSSNEDYEAAWAAALDQAAAVLGRIRHVAYGDLFLEDVRGFREGQARRFGFTPVFPLWAKPTGQLARDFVQAGYEAYLTCVDTTQLAPAFAGRRFDAPLLADLGRVQACVADLTYATAARFDMDTLPLVRAIFRARSLFMRAGLAPSRPFDRGLLTGATGLGWGTLLEEPGRLFIAGAYCQPWHGQVTFHPLTRESFSLFAEPGYVKIAWTLETIPEAAASCLLRTETRVVATDAPARSRFRSYWRWARFGIFTIRWLLLPAVRRQAERRARTGGISPA